MPTPKEIIKPYMKYCSKQDVHCSCPTCDSYEECKPFECNQCAANIDIDYKCHSRNKHLIKKYNQIERAWGIYAKKQWAKAQKRKG